MTSAKFAERGFFATLTGIWRYCYRCHQEFQTGEVAVFEVAQVVTKKEQEARLKEFQIEHAKDHAEAWTVLQLVHKKCPTGIEEEAT